MIASTTQPAVDFESATDLPSLYALLDQVQVKNGWSKAVPVIVPEPRQRFVPHRWRYPDVRAALHVAGRLVGTQWAERRNLIMANPIAGNDYATVPTLVGAYQMVKAGETARAHRHTPNAMRIVLEAGPRTFTIVDGARVPMEPGDVLLTPNWCWHGHSNEGTTDAYWVDVLDAPLTAALGAMFFQHHPGAVLDAGDVVPRSPLRFAFAEYGPKVDAAPETSAGVRELILGPATLVTFDRVAIHLGGGVRWAPDRSTANQILVVVQGRGSSRVGEREFTWERGDMIAAPAWCDQSHQADVETILLRVSDEPLMRMLGWYHSGQSMAAAKRQG
jgi:gentisate 1,2-dioxygenase